MEGTAGAEGDTEGEEWGGGSEEEEEEEEEGVQIYRWGWKMDCCFWGALLFGSWDKNKVSLEKL